MMTLVPPQAKLTCDSSASSTLISEDEGDGKKVELHIDLRLAVKTLLATYHQHWERERERERDGNHGDAWRWRWAAFCAAMMCVCVHSLRVRWHADHLAVSTTHQHHQPVALVESRKQSRRRQEKRTALAIVSPWLSHSSRVPLCARHIKRLMMRLD